MHLRKLILIWALLALMLGQVTLAQHSVSHIDHGFSHAVSSHGDHDEHHNDKDNNNKKHECPECLLTKSLQTAFYNAPFTLSFVPQVETLVLQQRISVVSLKQYNSNTPRAPPAILI